MIERAHHAPRGRLRTDDGGFFRTIAGAAFAGEVGAFAGADAPAEWAGRCELHHAVRVLAPSSPT